MTSRFSGSPAETALCQAGSWYMSKLSTFAINLYSVGVQLRSLISLSCHKFKYTFGSNFPLYTNPVAPEPSTDKNGLQIHFCQPGPAVAHTLSPSSIQSQFSDAVFKWA